MSNTQANPASSSSTSATHPTSTPSTQPSSTANATQTPSARTTRSQARRSSLPNPTTTSTASSSKPALKKRTRSQADQDDDEAHPDPPTPASTTPSTSKVKGKNKQQPEQQQQSAKRPRRSLPNPPTTATESASTDPKGKKRAPRSLSPEPTASTSAATKKKTSYSLRSAAPTKQPPKTKPTPKMARRSSLHKGTTSKKPAGTAKGSGGPSGSTRKQQDLDDVDMDDDFDGDFPDGDDLFPDDDHAGAPSGSHMDDGEDDDQDDDDEDDDDDEEDELDRLRSGRAGGSAANAVAAARAAARESDNAAAALFGSDYRQLGGYMSGLSSRLKAILSSIKSKNRTIQLSALQEASEVLSVSTEDTLAGYFQVDAFVKEFVRIIAGKPSEPEEPSPKKKAVEGAAPSAAAEGGAADPEGSGDEHHDEHDDEGEDDEHGSDGEGDGGHEEDFIDIDDDDEDAALARALAMSAQDAYGSGDGGGGGGGGDGMVMMGDDPSADNLEAQLLACRCLYNLMEALPGSAHTVVHHGAVPILCSKLLEIQYIELAEQTLSTMEKISQEYPDAIVRERGLSALLSFLDFFSTHVQRTAVTAAANCLRGVSKESFPMVKDVFPMLRNVLGYPDQRLVEQGSLAVLRAIESFRHRADHLETLLDVDLVKALNQLLTPAGGSPVLTPATYTHLLKALTTAAKASPKVTLAFLEAGMVDTLYQILTGVFPGAHDADEQGNPADGQGLAGGLADMVVLHNLAHRPKDQIEEALALLTELMPPLVRDGVFDSKAYSEKALTRLVRAKAKASRASSRQASSTNLTAPTPTPTASTDDLPSKSASDPTAVEGVSSPADTSAASGANADVSASAASVAVEDPVLAAQKAKVNEADQALEARVALLKTRPELTDRFLKMIVPVLVDVYAASVALRVRTKVLTGLLKTVSFLSAEDLTKVLKNGPLASFLGSILSSRDNPTLSLGALQLVELLLTKLPLVYRTSFRREGVMYEIDLLADEELSTAKAGAKKPSAVVKLEEQDSLPIGRARTTSGSGAPGPSSAEPLPLPSFGAPPAPPGSASTAVSRSALAQSLLASVAAGMPISSIGASSSSPAAKRPSAPIDPQDANILRARVMRLKTVSESTDSDSDDEAVKALDNMRTLVTAMNDEDASVGQLKEIVTKLAKLFGDETNSVSSFELLKSGLVDGLLECATINGKASSAARRRVLFEILSQEGSEGSKSPLAMLVKRLQESLSRMEAFEVTTAFQGLPGEDSRRSSTALLARQLRLKLLADEDSDIPKYCSAMVVSIQAIATFQALNDYLRPKISAPPPGPGGGMSSRLSSMYSAYAAAAGLTPPGGGPPSSRTASSAVGSLAAALAAASRPDRSGGASIEDEDVKPTLDALAADLAAASSGTEAASPSTAKAKPEKLSRRRSARLSGTELGGTGASTSSAAAGGAGSSAAAPAAEGAAGPSSSVDEGDPLDGMLPQDGDLYMYDDDGFSDEEMYDDDLDEELPPPPTEKTVDLSVAADGKKVEAKTPDGTRIGTPLQRPASAAEGTSASPSRPAPNPTGSSSQTSSYASALKAKPSDWHLEFSIGGQTLPLDTTIYGAIHQHESRSGLTNGLQRGVWSGVYTINFKKVAGPAPPPSKEASPEPSTREPSSATALPNSVPSDSAQAKILRLLRVLHSLNAEAGALLVSPRPTVLAESAFVNNKLTAKLARQLEEPMILASSCLPDWAMDLPRFFPFLFPFETRFAFLQSTSFGYARLIQKWQSQQAKSDSRRDDSLGFLSRLQRQKVRISRNHLLESAVKVFELYGASTSILEVEYFEEVGTGLGPTLEFYSLASKEFGRRDLKLWRDADATAPGAYVHRPQGFFPKPAEGEEATVIGVVQTKIFKVLGQFVAKALMDSRIIDMSFNPVFLKLVLGHDVPLTLESLRSVDGRLAKSLEKVAEFADAKKALLTDLTLSDEERATAVADLTINGSRLIDFCLDFTLPGYDIELKEGGNDLVVDTSNVEEYLEKVIDMTLVKGTAAQVQAFRAGFSTIFPVRDLLAFSPDELVILFGSAEEDWGADTLSEVLKADHGYNIESRSIGNLIDVMSTYEAPVRREFLQFITGAPKLPIGGFRGLNPPLTVVRKGHEPPFKADDYLPSVMTCVNYLKLPDYTSRDVLAAKLLTAMREGGGSFHLS